jgi:hypothetical protein
MGAGRAAAQQAAPPTAVEGQQELVALRVEETGFSLDERSVREAILRELELEDGPAPPGTSPVAIGLRVISGGELTVTIHAGEGQELSRSVATPARADEVPEVTALLVGNLARDEASGLLARLQRIEPEPEPAPTSTPAPAEPEKELPLDSVNLSLFYPLTLRWHSEERRFAIELGLLYGRIGALSGVALNGAVLQTMGSVSGVMLAGLGYWHGGSADGLRVGGAFGVGGVGLEGGSVAGIATIERGDVSGFQLSGGVNVADGSVDGAQITGIVNVAEAISGAQLAGALNLARGDADGVQVAGVVNLARGVEGVQVAGAVNLARGDVDGVQLSGGMNLAKRINGMQISVVNIGGDVDGAQIGIVNVARDVDGLQLGIVNVARDVDGVSIGYVPYSERGRTQALTWFSSSMPFNVGVRFDSGALYVMPTFGYDPRGDAVLLDPVNGDYAPGLSLGTHLNIGRAFADLDVNYSNRSNGRAYDEHDIDLRYRVLGGLQVTRAFGVFAGGGLRHHMRTQSPTDQFVKPELSVGIQLL